MSLGEKITNGALVTPPLDPYQWPICCKFSSYCVFKPYKCDTPREIPTLSLSKRSNILFTCITNMKKCLWWQILWHALYWKLPTRQSVVKPVIAWLSPLQPMCVYVCVCVCMWGTVISGSGNGKTNTDFLVGFLKTYLNLRNTLERNLNHTKSFIHFV